MKAAIPFCFVLAAACLGFTSSKVESEVHGSANQETLDVHESSAGASLAGQFRTSLTSWLWLHSDLYLHNGVEMRPLTEGEQKVGRTTERSSDKDIKEEARVTVIPAANNDFRGVFGDVDRATTAYKDMHNHVHNDPQVALPLFNLMTVVDPTFVPAYSMEASIIGRDSIGVRQALMVLDKGLEQNPADLELTVDKAAILAQKLHQVQPAISALKACIEKAKTNFDRLSDDQRDALDEAYRWLAMCSREVDPAQARAVATEGHRLFGDDPFFPNFLARLR